MRGAGERLIQGRQRTSILVTCVTPGENFLDGDSACYFTKLLDIFDRLIDFLLPQMRLRDNSRDGPTIPGDDDGLTLFDFIEQLMRAGFSLGCLDFACHR